MDKISEQTAMDIKTRRQIIGVSQRVLAEEAEVSYRTVLRFEKGGHIREKKFEKVIRALERLEQSGRKPGLWWLSHKEIGQGGK